MKKKSIYIILIIACVSIIWGISYYREKYAYAIAKEYYSVPPQKQSDLKVGIIGDSWVVRQNLEKLVQEKLNSKGVKAHVFSSGNPGGRSKNIYENLFKPEGELYSSKKVIENQPKYCVVLAGVNDAITQSGPDFYSHHMRMIINTLLHYKITPIIVNVPHVGLNENFAEKNGFIKLSNKVSSKLINKGEDLTVDDYREQLILDLKKNNVLDKVILINPDEVDINFYTNKNWFADPLHMNQSGYDIFSSFLAQKISDLEK